MPDGFSGDLNKLAMAEVKTVVDETTKEPLTNGEERVNDEDARRSNEPVVYTARVGNTQLIPNTRRYSLELDIEFPSYNKEGVLGTDNVVSKGARCLLRAAGELGQVILAYCEGRPEQRDLTTLLGLIYNNATITFERAFRPKGSIDPITRTPTEFNQFETTIKKVILSETPTLVKFRMFEVSELRKEIQAEKQQQKQAIADPFAIQ